MATLTCGENGSTGQQVITQINTNTDNISDLALRTNITESDISTNKDNIALNTQNISSNDSDISALTTRMGTAESNISSNDSDISTLTTRMETAESNIVSNDVEIAELHTKAPFVPLFKYTEVNGVLITASTYQPVALLVESNAPAGTYKVESQLFWTINVGSRPAYFRKSSDGGVNWIELEIEVQDTGNQDVTNSFDIINHISGDINFIVEARVENAGDELTIFSTKINLERKI